MIRPFPLLRGVAFLVTALLAASVAPGHPFLEAAKATLAPPAGELQVDGLRGPVTVRRDPWGVPHLQANSTHDLFFSQGFVAAQDHLWQMELWRRSGEGSLAEVLGPAYVERDRFARMLAYRGDWEREYRQYHPEGREIFTAYADGVNAAIRVALSSGRVPLEFRLMGFEPKPDWTPRTLLSRMPAWRLSRNVPAELARALAVKQLGERRAAELTVTDPPTAWRVPDGLNLDDIRPEILDASRNAGDFWWKFKPSLPAGITVHRPLSGVPFTQPEPVRPAFSFDPDSDLAWGSNNWVVGGAKSATGHPLLANDPHREVMNPALRSFVHLTAPGWNVIGMTEPGMPGVCVGHNEHVAWGFTILGVDQQDLYVEETNPEDPDQYLYQGRWHDMRREEEVLRVKGGPAAGTVLALRWTRHGVVIHRDPARHRAYALRWAGAEAGAAGYLGALNVLQARDWETFTAGVARSWYLPSHSIVYADTSGNYGYVAAALSPVRRNWDGLLPVPGQDGTYEWEGFVPLASLPRELNHPRGFYASANNDVVPRWFPGSDLRLGLEYAASYRFDRIQEVLSQDRRFSLADLAALQNDELSLPARRLVPLLTAVRTEEPGLRDALGRLARWDHVVTADSVAAAIYEFWIRHVTPLAYDQHLPADLRGRFRPHDLRRVVAWLEEPDAAFGADPRAGRDRVMLAALRAAVAELAARQGPDPAGWQWGRIHQARFAHPLLDESTRVLAHVPPVPRGGDAFTVRATGGVSEAGADQVHGASAMMLLDAQDWDRSLALNAPGNVSQFGSPYYGSLAADWGAARYFTLAFSEDKVREVTRATLTLLPGPAADPQGR